MANYNIVKLLQNRNIGNALSRNKNNYKECKIKGPTTWEKIIAEKIFLRRIYTGLRTVQECEIRDSRAKFLIVFSSDGTKIAATNGNHNVYIIDVKTKKILNTLSGHKRTPWTVAFHPTNNSVLASGCLNGEVRVWNLDDDSCEVWASPGLSVIASLAFHPKVKLLLIATYKEIYFWDWSTMLILGQTSTENEEEKIRYVKFDSTGDKLITAIALSGKLLSQYDSISFREVFHFTRERSILRSVQIIQKYCERHVSKLTEIKIDDKVTELRSNPSDQQDKTTFTSVFGPNSRVDLIEEIMPYMCIYHHDAIQSFLNVECFCPTKFSQQVMDKFKKDSLPVEYFAKCYFCRYTWLYQAIFEFQVINDSKSHICQEFRFMMNDKHVWKFSNVRLQELKNENKDVENGLTEETIRYCFEQYARTRIAPSFAKLKVCSKCFEPCVPNYEYSKEDGVPDTGKPFSHNVSMRSDCFLNVCEMFKFSPSGSFAPFMTTFAELYQYLPALQQISTKEDSNVLNTTMTEWEYLYCKLLLINNIIEGDDGLMLKKRPAKHLSKTQQSSSNNKQFEGSSSANTYFKLEQFRNRLLNKRSFAEQEASHSKAVSYVGKKTCCFNHKIQNESANASGSTSASLRENSNGITNAVATVPDTCVNYQKLREECDLCRPFDENYEKTNLNAATMLRKTCDNFGNACLRRNDPKIQRSRIEKLYKQQLNIEINRIDGALFRTIQVTKKCIRVYISSLLTELKKLLKFNFAPSKNNKLPFNKVLPRLFILIARRTVIFIGNLLEFLSNFKYDIHELTEIDSIKIVSSQPLFPTMQFRQNRYRDNFNPRRDYTFDISCNDEPVFEEELENMLSELSDDELSSSISDNIFSRKDVQHFSSYLEKASRPGSSSLSQTSNIASLVSSRRITASANYIEKHLRFLDYIGERWSPEHSIPDSYQLLLLQNVNSLFNHFQCQSIEEPAESNRHHPLHRLQMWDFSKLQIPSISSRVQNVVVTECKVHNDSTIAISNDDTRVAVLLSPNQYDQPDWLGVFSLEWKTLGQILCAVSLKQVAVSLSFSPTDQHLAVGYSYTYTENLKMADIIAVQREINTWKNFGRRNERNTPIASSLIDLSVDDRAGLLTTVNCIKWIPVSGHGLVFGNSVGELKFVF